MARQKGMLNLSGNLEPLAGAPLDSRDITPTVADLYIASNWPYKYIGMKTTVTATGATYRLVNLDVTQESSWVKEETDTVANPENEATAVLNKIAIGGVTYSLPSGGGGGGRSVSTMTPNIENQLFNEPNNNVGSIVLEEEE